MKAEKRGRGRHGTRYGAGMTPRARVVLLFVAPLVAMASLLVVGGVAAGSGPSGASALLDADDGPNVVVVATVTKPQPVRAAVRGLSLVMAVSAGLAWIVSSGRRRSMRCLTRRLDDVGDGWRALLLGAPPVLL